MYPSYQINFVNCNKYFLTEISEDQKKELVFLEQNQPVFCG